MFVESKRSWRNPKTNFFYNKELLTKGNKSERLVFSFLERLDNPKVSFSAYKHFSIMSKEKNFVTLNAVRISVAPTQQTETVNYDLEFNKLIIQYVSTRLKYKCKVLDEILPPICPQYLTIYDCSILKLN